MIFILWFVFVIVLTIWADNWKKCGGYICLISILLSPLAGFIALVVWPEPTKLLRCKHCGHEMRVKSGDIAPKYCPMCHKDDNGNYLSTHKCNCNHP